MITGAGPIGIMAAAVARHVGARHIVITDVNAARLALAAQVAEVVPVNVATENLRSVMDSLGMREGFDVGLEMSGAPAALDQMIDHMVMGGRIALLGIPARPIPFDLGKVVFRMITLKGIYGREMFETWHKMLAMLESGLDVRKVITSRVPADAYQDAFNAAAAGSSGRSFSTGEATRPLAPAHSWHFYPRPTKGMAVAMTVRTGRSRRAEGSPYKRRPWLPARHRWWAQWPRCHRPATFPW